MSPDDRVRSLLEEGLFCLGLSKEDEALDRWRAVLEIEPDNGRAREYINFVLEQRGELVVTEPEAAAAAVVADTPERLDVSSGVFRRTESGELVAVTAQDLPPADGAPATGVVEPAEETPSGPVEATAAEAAPAEPVEAAATGSASTPEHGRISGDTAPIFLPAEMLEDIALAEATVSETEVEPTAQPAAVAPAPEPVEELPAPAAPPPELVQAPAAEPVETLPPPAAPAMDEAAPEENPLFQGALDLFEAGEYSEALSLIERVLAAEPDDQEADALRERVREALLGQYKARIGALSETPRVDVPDGDLVWLNLDPRAAFLLSRVDGILTFEEIIDLSNLDAFTANKLLHDFLQEGLISVGD